MFETILGCAVLVVCNLSLLYAAHLLVRRFYPSAPPAARLVALGTVFCALILLVLQALSPFHAISRSGVTLSCLVIALLFHRFLGKYKNLGAELEPVTAWMRDGLASRWSALIIACGFVVLLSISRALLMPPMSWDSITYHLTFAAYWVQKGSLLRFIAPDQIIENAYLPINGELLAAWLMLPFHNDLLANTLNFPITLLGGIACYAIARELGLTRTEASFAPALLCFAPVIYAQITTAYVDNAVFAFCAASVLFTLRYVRTGHRADALLAYTTAGILIGIKYSGIPVAGFVLLAILIKRLLHAFNPGRTCGNLCVGLLLLFSMGGRQYVLNILDAGNPLYPVPITVLNHLVAEGSQKLEEVNAWVNQHEAQNGLDRLSFWEREYKKLQYLSRAAGPKFLFFFMIAALSPFMRPRRIHRGQWYFLILSWTAPIILFYAPNPADYIRKANWIVGSSRFLSPFIALFTIQGLVLTKHFTRNFDSMGFFFVLLIIWDLFNVDIAQLWEVEALYPVLVLLVGLIILALFFLGISSAKLAGARRWLVCLLVSTAVVGGIYFLQSFRDTTRYKYYRQHCDYHPVPRIEKLVSGWEFLDKPKEKKTIALSVGWDPPGHIWFFYPLMGRRLQNEVLYVSSKYKQDVPAWFHQNMLRGDDVEIWLANVRKKKVDYIFFATPWPKELNWLNMNTQTFQLVLADQYLRIYKYKGKDA